MPPWYAPPCRLAYFTVLRDPIDRFLSEWKHVQRGATWMSASLKCHGRRPPSEHYRLCVFFQRRPAARPQKKRRLPIDVSLAEFLRCPHNLALNRQTRMLANLSALGCYTDLVDWSVPRGNTGKKTLSEKQKLLLSSATFTLIERIRMFGLYEHLLFTQYLLQIRMNISFNHVVDQIKNLSNETHAYRTKRKLNGELLTAVESANILDSKLYGLSKRVFTLRIATHLLYDSRLPIALRRALFKRHPFSQSGDLESLLLDEQKGNSFRINLHTSLRLILMRRKLRGSTASIGLWISFVINLATNVSVLCVL